MKATIIALGLLAHASLSIARSQNVVERSPHDAVREPVSLPAGFAEQLVREFPKPAFTAPVTAEARRVAAKLEAHVSELIDGWPWRPLHHVLGISGAETCFAHPDEMFYAVSLALPHLSEEKRKVAIEFLAARLAENPPYGRDGFDRAVGNARESYTVPTGLRRNGRGEARSAFGIAAFYTYANWSGQWSQDVPLDVHWPRILDRIQPLLGRDYGFDIRKPGEGRDAAEQLNGDLTGLIAFARLARRQREQASFDRAIARVQQLAQLRVDLECVNPVILERTNSASKGLHNYKLARYCGLTEDIARCLRGPAGELAAARLRAFREARNGWYLALGDRFVGGENYTNPLHFGRALFAGAALLERLPGDELFRFIDVPSCKADFYFIEKCALALQSTAR